MARPLKKTTRSVADLRSPTAPRALVEGADRNRVRRHLRSVGAGIQVVDDGPNGRHDIVVLSAKDYATLIDRVEVSAARAAWRRTRKEESVPIDLAARLVAGEHPVRAWRRHRGLGLIDLARRTGLAKGYLSEIETGKKTGRLDTLRRIATALAIDLDDMAAWIKT